MRKQQEKAQILNSLHNFWPILFKIVKVMKTKPRLWKLSTDQRVTEEKTKYSVVI